MTEMALVSITYKLALGKSRVFFTYVDPRLTLYFRDVRVRSCQDVSIMSDRCMDVVTTLLNIMGYNTKSITLELSLFPFPLLHGHGAYDGKIQCMNI